MPRSSLGRRVGLCARVLPLLLVCSHLGLASNPHFSSTGLLRRRNHPPWLCFARSVSSTYCTSTTAEASVASLARTALAAPRYDKRREMRANDDLPLAVPLTIHRQASTCCLRVNRQRHVCELACSSTLDRADWNRLGGSHLASPMGSWHLAPFLQDVHLSIPLCCWLFATSTAGVGTTSRCGRFLDGQVHAGCAQSVGSVGFSRFFCDKPFTATVLVRTCGHIWSCSLEAMAQETMDFGNAGSIDDMDTLDVCGQLDRSPRPGL